MEERKSDRPQAGWFSYSAMGQGPAPARPLDEAYSRVTNPERFEPLHEWALGTVARLNSEYEVTLEEGLGLDDELERGPLARPTIKLTPSQVSCAPVTIAFTDFPGLEVRVGNWVTEVFPSCGCDACDEMPEEEFERLTRLLNNVVAGRFRESMRLDPEGTGWSTREFWNGERRSSGGALQSGRKATLILGGKSEMVVEWMPWRPRL